MGVGKSLFAADMGWGGASTEPVVSFLCEPFQSQPASSSCLLVNTTAARRATPPPMLSQPHSPGVSHTFISVLPKVSPGFILGEAALLLSQHLKPELESTY